MKIVRTLFRPNNIEIADADTLLGTCILDNNCDAYMNATPELRDDKELFMRIFEQRCIYDRAEALEYLSDRLKDDEEVVMACVKLSEHSFRFASDRLKDDEEFVITCTRLSPQAFKYASDRIRSDYDLAYAAVSADQNCDAFRYCGENLLDNKQFVIDVFNVCKCKNNLQFWVVSERLWDDKDFVDAAFSVHQEAFRYASKRLQDDAEFAESICSRCPGMLKYVSDRLKNDKNFTGKIIALDTDSKM